MHADEAKTRRKRLSGRRLAVLLAAIGVLMIAFVVATEGEHGLWTLWIAVPMLMVSLGYLFLVNAIPVFLSYDEHLRSEDEKKDERRDD